MTDEKKFEVHAEITVRLTQQDVDDIMVSALEGGICYWCRRVVVQGKYLGEYASDQISRGGQLAVWLETATDILCAAFWAIVGAMAVVGLARLFLGRRW